MTVKVISLVFVVLAICMLAAWYLIPKFLEQPSYEVIKKDGKIEIRSYKAILLQSVKVSGEQYEALRQGFRPLVRYIGAKERSGEKISMTAPVMQSFSEDDGGWVVSFSMPSKYSKNNLPNPNNDEVYTEQIHPTFAAVIRFSGRANSDLLVSKTKELMKWLNKSGYEANGQPRYMFYNDPSTPPFLRRNEVMIAVK